MNFDASTAAAWNGKEIQQHMTKELGNEFYSSARRIEASAKNKVSRSDYPITAKHPGHLQDTIRAARARRKKWMPGAFVFAGDRAKGIYWGHMVEYGTSKMEAQPFLRPAMQGQRATIISGATRGGRRVIKKPRRTVR